MKIFMHLVDKLIHYAPIYSVFEDKSKKYDVEYIITGSDQETVKRLYANAPQNDNEIHLFLTSVSDLSDRLRILNIIPTFNQSVLWTVFIDKIPLWVIGNENSNEVII